MMRTDDLDFQLPEELIAQTPSAQREASRLLHYVRSDRSSVHRVFSDVPSILHKGDLLVLNDTRVIPARFALRKITGGVVEGLFLAELSLGQWRAMLKNLGPFVAGVELEFIELPGVKVRLDCHEGDGQFRLTLSDARPAAQLLELIGRMPLPPYIKRQKVKDDRDVLDRDRYQTTFNRAVGSIAAPTAGLHFTPAIFDALEQRGVQKAFVTLDVGVGTFKPVTADTLEDHAMHCERYELSEATCQAINLAKRERRRVVCVGTTSARVLESQPPGELKPARGETRIFIYPPYEWKHVDALITNFHLPRSTLIALVAAMVGLDEQRRIYAEAIAKKYRFFSYGDAMFID